MNIGEILLSSAFIAAGIGVITYLSREWITTRLKESIGAEYKRALERYKQEIAWEERRKQQAAEIAKVLSMWLEHSYHPQKDVNDIRFELQQKYWEMVLWLDTPVLKALHAAFASASNPGLAHKEALIQVRRAFVGAHDMIQPDELYHWDAIPKPTPPDVEKSESCA